MLEIEKLSNTEKKVYQALKKVIDPELQVNIVDLGLIYGIEVSETKCQITMTLTITAMKLMSAKLNSFGIRNGIQV